jgi:membrane protease YdiL (CAAX protease family)
MLDRSLIPKTSAKVASRFLTWWAWGLLILFPISYLSLVYVVGKNGRLVPTPFVLMLNHTLMFMLLWGILRRAGWRLSDIGWRVSGGWSGLLLQVSVGSAAGVVLYFLDRFTTGPLSERICNALHWTYAGIPHAQPKPSLALFVGVIVASTLFAGLVEESVYRGYAITVLRQKLRPASAVMVTSLFFGALHLGFFGAQGMVANFFDGLLLAGLYLWRKSLLPPVLAHAIADAIAFLS